MVPGNDDSTRSIRFYAKSVADVILEARVSVLDNTDATDFIEVEEAKLAAPEQDDNLGDAAGQN